MMESELSSRSNLTTKPRLIIHGGAGNISRSMPAAHRHEVASALLSVVESTHSLLIKNYSALDVATHAVRLMENIRHCNCGHGAVFTRIGTIESFQRNTSGRRQDGKSIGGVLKERGMGVTQATILKIICHKALSERLFLIPLGV